MNIYKDKLINIHTPERAATKGHITIGSTITKTNTEEDFAQLFSAASFVSTILFEQAGAHGTNILIDDLHKELQANILARTEGDDISFQWKTKEYSQGEIDSYHKRIKDRCDYVKEGNKKIENKTKEQHNSTENKSASQTANEEKSSSSNIQKEKNYLIEQLNRIP